MRDVGPGKYLHAVDLAEIDIGVGFLMCEGVSEVDPVPFRVVNIAVELHVLKEVGVVLVGGVGGEVVGGYW